MPPLWVCLVFLALSVVTATALYGAWQLGREQPTPPPQPRRIVVRGPVEYL